MVKPGSDRTWRASAKEGGAERLVPRAVFRGLLAVLSLGWLVPALIAWRLTTEAAPQVAAAGRHLNSFPYEKSASDLAAVAWWWGLTAAIAWAMGAAAYLRWRRRVG